MINAHGMCHGAEHAHSHTHAGQKTKHIATSVKTLKLHSETSQIDKLEKRRPTSCVEREFLPVYNTFDYFSYPGLVAGEHF